MCKEQNTNMYEKYTERELYECYSSKDIMIYSCTINKTQLLCTSSGKIFRKMKSGSWKEIENKNNHSKGYNVILIDKKQYTRAKLILYAVNKINLKDKRVNIYHINGNRLDCNIENLTYQVPKRT